MTRPSIHRVPPAECKPNLEQARGIKQKVIIWCREVIGWKHISTTACDGTILIGKSSMINYVLTNELPTVSMLAGYIFRKACYSGQASSLPTYLPTIVPTKPIE